MKVLYGKLPPALQNWACKYFRIPLPMTLQLLLAVPLLMIISLAVCFFMWVGFAARRTEKIVREHGGRIRIEEIKSRLGRRPYSLVSLENPGGKPEIWVFPNDIGNRWSPDSNYLSSVQSHRPSEVAIEELRIFRENWLDQEAWILDADDELMAAIRQMTGAIDLAEEKIGHAAVQKKDFSLINRK